MSATTLVLAGLALAFAGPVTALLEVSPRLRRTPRVTMLLWQSVALAAVLSALGATLSFSTDHAVPSSSWRSYGVAGLALLVLLVVLGRLLVSGHQVGLRLRLLRHRHRRLVDLVGTEQHGARVVDSVRPAAYCVPALARSRVVLSRATVEALTVDELAGVLAHERAHLRARHDLVLEAFTVLGRAFPGVVLFRRALEEVRLLVEVLADRAARRLVGPRPLVGALSTLGACGAPEASLGMAAVGISVRLELLLDPRRYRVQAACVALVAGGVLVLPTVLVVLPWLRTLTGE